MLIEDLERIPEFLKSGYRGIMLLFRNKDGESANAQRKAIKRISTSTAEWEKSVHDMFILRQKTHPLHRIYSSINERDMNKAIHEFKRRQLEADYENNEERHKFYTDSQNRFFSCLMNPNCRIQNHFLIDCDTDEQYANAKRQIDPDLIVYDYPTKNGRHIITRPFNPNSVDNVQIMKDEMMYIG